MFAKKTKELPKVDPVKIKPLFGMKPGLWLTIAYILALFLILFLVAVLPDIIDAHKRVTFTSDSGTVAVYLDDVYQGGTPFTRKIKSGTHQVSYRLNGYEIDSFSIKVGTPVFFNWLFPRTQSVSSSATINQEAFDAVSLELLEKANAYSAILEYDSVHRYPEIFTKYANNVANSTFRTSGDAFEAASLFITTDEMLKDFENAASIIGINLLPLYKTLDESRTTGVQDAQTPVLKAGKTSLKTEWFTIEGFTIPEADFSNGKTVKATFPEIMEAGKTVHTDAFNIGSYLITEAQFQQFIASNPQWGKDNKDELIAKGLVDEYYLSGIDFSSGTANRPVNNISWYAADAFCKWLSEATGRNVTLPSENQWMAACLSDSEGGYQKSLMPSAAEKAPASLLGGLWDMTSTRFVPLSRIAADSQVEKAVEVLDRYDADTDMVVKGGSYVNDQSEISMYTTGLTSRSFCSSFIGFRIAWN